MFHSFRRCAVASIIGTALIAAGTATAHASSLNLTKGVPDIDAPSLTITYSGGAFTAVDAGGPGTGMYSFQPTSGPSTDPIVFGTFSITATEVGGVLQPGGEISITGMDTNTR